MRKLAAVIRIFLERVWGGLLTFLVERGEIAVRVTDIIKSAVENPALNWIVLMTPTQTDDAILAKAKELAPKIALQVGLAMGIIKKVDASENMLEASGKVIEYVRTFIPEEGRGIFYREFAGKFIEFSADGKISTAEAVALGQLVFKKIIGR